MKSFLVFWIKLILFNIVEGDILDFNINRNDNSTNHIYNSNNHVSTLYGQIDSGWSTPHSKGNYIYSCGPGATDC